MRQATENTDLDRALNRLDQIRPWLPELLARLESFVDLPSGSPALDVGSASGAMLVALAENGYSASGVEPYGPARMVSEELAAHTGLNLTVRSGSGEEIPYGDNSFQLITMISVLEHTDDPYQVLSECFRVLRPGGGLYFTTTDILCPRQNEIDRFPLFPWYPPPVQRKIMILARDRYPHLVGHTTRPAMHWFRHRQVRGWLEEIGYNQTIERWQLHASRAQGRRGQAIRLIAAHKSLRLIGNTIVGEMGYLAIK